MIVCKFGGTSVGDRAAIERLAGIVKGRLDSRPLVVVSAMSGVTNALLSLVEQTSAGDREGARARLGEIVARHRTTAGELGVPDALDDALATDVGLIDARLDSLAEGGGVDAVRDGVVSFGELWSSRLVNAALAVAGVESRWVDVRTVMRTDARFGRAVVDRQVLDQAAPPVFGPIVEAGIVPVTQGFLGATPDGRPTTLGRGGSDFSASLLGAALGAERVEIWTDVDGLMTADPRVVPDARLIEVASHHEAAELATFGAKVLHPSTYAPLIHAKIPCVILNSFAPGRPGTTILAGASVQPIEGSPVRSIAWKKGITLINVRATGMLEAVGFLRKLFEMVELHGISVDVVATSEVSVSLTIDDPTRLEALCRDLSTLGDVTTAAGRAIVAVVGIGLRTDPGIAGRIFSAVNPFNIEVISQGASAINMTFVIREDQAVSAVQLLHREFFPEAAA
ncbi:MAG: lysine-sensitive aspartokinase 3 [Gemmatimonadales bacterium]